MADQRSAHTRPSPPATSAPPTRALCIVHRYSTLACETLRRSAGACALRTPLQNPWLNPLSVMQVTKSMVRSNLRPETVAEREN